MSSLAKAADAYRFVARFYDALCALYSGGAVRRCRLAFVSEPEPGERALFAGAGTGEAAIDAARRGVRVVAVDLSPTMASRLRERLGPYPNAAVICADVFALEGLAEFDWVFANFFFNVFPESRLEPAFERLASVLRVGGHFVVGDFAPASHGWARWLQAGYYFVPILVFWCATGNAFHGLYDYEPYLEHARLSTRERRFFRAFGFGPRWFAALVAVKR